MNVQAKQTQASYCHERRVSEKNFDEHYEQLSDDQIISVYTLRKLGYDLLYVRTDTSGCKHAILIRDGVYASVFHNGFVELDTELHVREND